MQFSNDYSLSSNSFQLLNSLLPFHPEIDLFATRLTNKLPRYIPWQYDPYAWKINAFSCQWPNEAYLFFIINWISESVNKFIQDKVTYGVILTPAWPGLSAIPKILFHYCLMLQFLYLPSVSKASYLPATHSTWLLGLFPLFLPKPRLITRCINSHTAPCRLLRI